MQNVFLRRLSCDLVNKHNMRSSHDVTKRKQLRLRGFYIPKKGVIINYSAVCFERKEPHHDSPSPPLHTHKNNGIYPLSTTPSSILLYQRVLFSHRLYSTQLFRQPPIICNTSIHPAIHPRPTVQVKNREYSRDAAG